VLARLFRGKMLTMLMDAHDAGELKTEKRTFKCFIACTAWQC
jgi:hypothetical protein